MDNLRTYLPLVDGGQHPLEFDSGKEIIHELLSDDWGPPPTCFVIQATSADGRQVTISIPYSDSRTVGVRME